jgi:ABC-2 type transport system permease protein
MHKVWIVARHEYLANVRRTGFIVGLAFVPIIGVLALLVATLFGGQAGSFLEREFAPQANMIGVVDQVGNFSPILPAYQLQYELFSDESSGKDAVLSGKLDSLLVIPPDYLTTGKVTVLTKSTGINTVDLSTSRSFFVDQLLNNKLDPALRARVLDPFEPTVLTVGTEGATGQDTAAVVVNTMVAYFLGLLLVISIFISSGYLLRSVSEEKSNRVIEVILSSITASELLAGKVLGLGALGLTQVVVWLGSAFGLSLVAGSMFNISVPLVARPETLLLGIVYYVLGYLVYAVLTGSMGALGATMQESQQLSSIFTMMASVPLMIGGFMLSNPNMTLVRVLSWFPFTAPTMMLLRAPMADVPLIDFVGSIAVLLVTIPVVLFVGAKLFRAGLLMYGKRPSLRQIVRVLREA